MIVQEGLVNLPFEKTIVYLLSRNYSNIQDPYSPVPFNGGFLDYYNSNPERYKNLIEHLPLAIREFQDVKEDVNVDKLCPCNTALLSSDYISNHCCSNADKLLDPYLNCLDLPDEETVELYDDLTADSADERKKLYAPTYVQNLPADHPDSYAYNKDPLHIHYFWYLAYIDWLKFSAESYGSIRQDTFNSYVNNAMIDDETGDIETQADVYSTDAQELSEDFSVYEDSVYQLTQQLFRLGKRGPHKFDFKWRPLNFISFIACEQVRRKSSSTEVLTHFSKARLSDKARTGFYTAAELEAMNQAVRQNESFKWAADACMGHISVVSKLINTYLDLLEMLGIELISEDLSKFDPTPDNKLGSVYLPSNNEYTSEIYAALTDMVLIGENKAAEFEAQQTREITIEEGLDKFYSAEIQYETEDNKKLAVNDRYAPVTDILEEQEDTVVEFLNIMVSVVGDRYGTVFYIPRNIKFMNHVLVDDNDKPFLLNTRSFAFNYDASYDCVILDSGYIVPITENLKEVWYIPNALRMMCLFGNFKYAPTVSGGSLKVRCM